MTLNELREKLDALAQLGLGDVPVDVSLTRLDEDDTYGGEWSDHLNEVNLSIRDGAPVLELRSIPEWP